MHQQTGARQRCDSPCIAAPSQRCYAITIQHCASPDIATTRTALPALSGSTLQHHAHARQHFALTCIASPALQRSTALSIAALRLTGHRLACFALHIQRSTNAEHERALHRLACLAYHRSVGRDSAPPYPACLARQVITSKGLDSLHSGVPSQLRYAMLHSAQPLFTLSLTNPLLQVRFHIYVASYQVEL